MIQMAGRDEYIFMGLNTSGVFATGDHLLLGGTLMPPTPADVDFQVEWPSGKTDSYSARANHLGGVKPPSDLILDEPGVYRVKVDITLDKADGSQVHGDVVGSGDGEIFYFALPNDAPRVMASSLPAMSRAADPERIPIPLGWNPEVKNPRLTWSVMTPGSLFDEGQMDLEGSNHDFIWRPRQSSIQLENYDTVDYGTGKKLLTDIVVFVFFFEGEMDGEKVFDATRIVMRGDVLLNPDALIDPDELRGVGPFVGDPPEPMAEYPEASYQMDVDLDGLKVTYSEGQGSGQG